MRHLRMLPHVRPGLHPVQRQEHLPPLHLRQWSPTQRPKEHRLRAALHHPHLSLHIPQQRLPHQAEVRQGPLAARDRVLLRPDLPEDHQEPQPEGKRCDKDALGSLLWNSDAQRGAVRAS